MPRYEVEEVRVRQDDFSVGLISAVSQVGAGRVRRSVKKATNVVFRGRRAFSPRRGYHDISQVGLANKPTSLGKYYLSGANKLFVGLDDGAGGGGISLYTASAETPQTLPFTAADDWWDFKMFNGICIACQSGGVQKPIFYKSTNPANTWHSMVLPAPASAPTFGTDQAGGALAVTTDYFFRVRWNYDNGSSVASPVSVAKQVTAASSNYTIRVNVPLPGGTPRSDYVGWTLERTKENGTSEGPFYVVADGTAATYDSGEADADLFDMSREVLHGEPPHFEGVIGHAGRLFGWTGSDLYVSQPIVGDEATGICNWQADLFYPVAKDDGNDILTVHPQGDRLVIYKRRSIHVLEGVDVDSFVLRPLANWTGAAGPRAVASLGGVHFFAAGDGNLFALNGDDVAPVGDDEVGDYLAEADTSFDSQIVAKVDPHGFVCFFYTRSGDSYNRDVVAYDIKKRNWTHWQIGGMVDAYSPIDEGDFGHETMLIADPRELVVNTGDVSQNPSFLVFKSNAANANYYQVMVQKYDSNGAEQWTAGGVQVGVSISSNSEASVLPLADGGCIVVWIEAQVSGALLQVYAQRFDTDGVKQWTASGVALTSYTDSSLDAQTQGGAAVISDGTTDGCIVVWDAAVTGASGTYIQKLDGSGAAQWTAGGVFLGLGGAAVSPSASRVFSDGSGGAFVFHSRWSGANTLYMQHVNTSGVPQLTAGGVSIFANGYPDVMMDASTGDFFVACPAFNLLQIKRVTASGTVSWTSPNLITTNGYLAACLVPDGNGGVMVVWAEGNSGAANIMVHRVNGDGTLQWSSPVQLAGGAIMPTQLTLGFEYLWAVPDSKGGVIVAWAANEGGGTQTDVYAAQVNNQAGSDWPNSIIGIANLANYEMQVVGCTDGAKGMILAWGYGSIAFPGDMDLYIQRVGVGGSSLWTAGGVVVSAAANNQRPLGLAFTSAPEGEYVPIDAGYHVWSFYKNFRDGADANGAGGDPIPISVDTGFLDNGNPRLQQVIEEIEVMVNRGYADISAVITPSGGAKPAAILLSPRSSAPTFGTFKFGDGTKLGRTGSGNVSSGVRRGCIGKAHAIRLAASVSADIEIGGYEFAGYALPKRRLI